jgi:hypothetical protein
VTTFGAASCTHFKRHGSTTYGRLEWGYRAVGLFAAAFEQPGASDVRHLACDEGFEAAHFDGTQNQVADDLDLLYVAAHGELRRNVFQLVLHAGAWEPSSAGLDGSSGPRVAVFDACNLADLNDPDWPVPWEAVVRPRLRLVCGFASNATVGKGPTERGREFAELLEANEPVAGAWLHAVVTHSSWFPRDTAVVVGLGADKADANDVLDATLHDLLAMPDLTGPATAVARKARR